MSNIFSFWAQQTDDLGGRWCRTCAKCCRTCLQRPAGRTVHVGVWGVPDRGFGSRQGKRNLPVRGSTVSHRHAAGWKDLCDVSVKRSEDGLALSQLHNDLYEWNVTMRLAVALNWIAPSESPEIIHGVSRNGKSFQVCRTQRDTE